MNRLDRQLGRRTVGFLWEMIASVQNRRTQVENRGAGSVEVKMGAEMK